MVTFQDYINTLKSGVYKPICKIEFLRNEDESVYSEFSSYLIGGSININKNNGIRRSCSLELDNSKLTFKINKDELWINSKFRVWLGLNINDEDYLFKQGTFVLSDPEMASNLSSKTISLKGDDKFSLLNGVNGGKITSIYQIPLGTTVPNAIKGILTQTGEKLTPIIQNISNVTPYTIRKEYGGSYGDIIVELCEMASCDVYYNVDGRLVVEKPLDDKYLGSQWDFNTDEPLYLGCSHGFKFSEVYNIQTIVGANINGAIASATVKDENLQSPTRVQLIGEKPAEPILDDVISTDAEALERANYELKKSIALQETVNLNSMPMYHLDVGNIVTITDSSAGFKDKDRFTIQSINLGFRTSDKLSLGLWKSRDLF